MGICAPLALGDAEGAVGAACGAGVGLVSGLVEGGVHVEAGRRRHLDADEVEALELDARDLAHGRDAPRAVEPLLLDRLMSLWREEVLTKSR